MVIRKKQLFAAGLILLLAVAAGIFLWYRLRPTDENRIRARFAKLTGLVAKNGKEGAIPAAGKAKEAAGLFSDKCTFSVNGLDWMSGPFSRKNLSGQIFRSRAMFNSLALSLDLLELDIDPDKGTARVFLTATLTGTLRDGKTVREVRELESKLTRTDDGWLFENFKIRELIKK